MWQEQTPAQWQRLGKIGVSAGKTFPDRSETPSDGVTDTMRTLQNAGFPWYVENITTDFYSAYHRWRPGQEVNAAFVEAQAHHRAAPDSLAPFKRDPSLSDPIWQRRIRDRLTRVVHQQARYRPLYYCLGDETGIADLSAYWDFDFSDDSLRGFRVWLKERYGSLAALNRQWNRHFPRWDAVMPETARQAIQTTDDNFSAWADFREWMDVAFAHALRLGTDAIHEADKDALSGIEGGQVAGWGGYDYARLATAVDVLEVSGINADMARSFNPRLVTLTTVSHSGPVERHRIWHEVLHGNRGLILWDEKSAFATRDGRLGPRGQDAAPTYTRLRDGLGALLINSVAEPARVAIHYSQASQRIRWILERKSDGPDGIERETNADRSDSAFNRRRDLYARLIEDAGAQYRFLSAAQLAAGRLNAERVPILVLPDSIALSKAETGAIRRYVAQGGTVIADGEPGLFDEHGRRRATTPLAAERERILRVDADNDRDRRTLRQIFETRGAVQGFTATEGQGAPAQGVERHVFRNGGITILALLNAAPKDRDTRPIIISLPHPRYLYDLGNGRALGQTQRLSIDLPADDPILLASSPLASAPLGQGEPPHGAARNERLPPR